MKISLIGLGNVGKAVLSFLPASRGINEIAIVERNELAAKYEAMDMNHAASLLGNSQPAISHGDYELLAGSDIVVITSGVPMKGGIDTKVKLALANKDLIDELAVHIGNYCPDSIVIILTNPVETMTNAFIRASGFNPRKVIGTGTLNDTSRLKYYLSMRLGADYKDINAIVMGEHVVGNFIPWSNCSINGIAFAEYLENTDVYDFDGKEALDYINQSAFEILGGKGNTTFSIAGAVTRIIKAVIDDENAVLPVAALMGGEYNIDGLVVSLPCIVGRSGIISIEELYLNTEELFELEKSVKSLSKLNSIFLR